MFGQCLKKGAIIYVTRKNIRMRRGENGLGTFGGPAGATQETGEIIYGRCVKYVAEVIEKVKNLPVTMRNREWNARVL